MGILEAGGLNVSGLVNAGSSSSGLVGTSSTADSCAHAATMASSSGVSTETRPRLRVDLDARRRWEFQRRKWTLSRTLNVVKQVGRLWGAIAGLDASYGQKDFLSDVEKLTNSTTRFRTFWQLLLPRVSPRINQMVMTWTSIKEVSWLGYEGVREPPTKLATYVQAAPVSEPWRAHVLLTYRTVCQ